MKYSLILFIGLYSHSAIFAAEELTVSVNAKNELVLVANSCPMLLKQEAALCEFKKKAEPAFVIPIELSKKCTPLAKGKVKLVISTCLPEFAKTFQQKKLIHDGPNCWGTAMSFNKLSPRPRFMWPEEMMYWTNSSPLCRKLEAGEIALPGDVINIYAPEKMDQNERSETDAGTRFWESLYPNRLTPALLNTDGSDYTGFHRLLHSATFISKDLAFGKDSPSKEDNFYFHPMGQVYGRPGSEEKGCQENQLLEPYLREYQKSPKKIRGSVCSYFSQVYRCENFADYFSKLSLNEANLSTWENVQSLQGLQAKLFPLLTSSQKVLEDCEVTLILSLADITVKRISSELRALKQDKNREMLLTMEYFAAAGIRQTLEQVGLAKKIK